MSAYGRQWEAQRPSRDAHREARLRMLEVVEALRKATALTGRGALIAEAKALLVKIEQAKHEEIPE